MTDQIPTGTIYQFNHSGFGIRYKVFNGTEWILIDQVDQNDYAQVRERAKEIVDQELWDRYWKSSQYDDPFA